MVQCVFTSSLFDLNPLADKAWVLQTGGLSFKGAWSKSRRTLHWASEGSAMNLELHAISIVAADGRQIGRFPVAPAAVMGSSGHYSYADAIPQLYWKAAGVDSTIQFFLRARLASRLTAQTTGILPMDMIDNYTTNDVVFIFPRTKMTPRYLWADSAKLANASSYFKDLFFGGFAESELHPAPTIAASILEIPAAPRRSIEGKKAAPEMIKEGAETPDSTTTTSASTPVEQTDDGMSEDESPQVDDSDYESDTADLGPSPQSRPIRRVIIKDTSYKTYRALLYYLATSEVVFSPLTSTVAGAEIAELEKDTAPAPPTDYSTPLPVSPKSLYRLAHSLSLATLQEECLDNITSQLTASNVIQELFSPFSACYDEVKEAAIETALANWDEVVKSKGMQDFESRLSAGEVEGSLSRIAVELFKRLKPVSA